MVNFVCIAEISRQDLYLIIAECVVIEILKKEINKKNVNVAVFFFNLLFLSSSSPSSSIHKMP